MSAAGISLLPTLHLVPFLPQRALNPCRGVTYIDIHSPLSTLRSPTSTLRPPLSTLPSPPAEIRFMKTFTSLLFEREARVLINIREHIQFLTFSVRSVILRVRSIAHRQQFSSGL